MEKKRAFTLVELLVVISIIALLMAVLVPGLGVARELARRVVCGTNMKGIGQANMSYVNAWNGYFVPLSYPGRDKDGNPVSIEWSRNPDFRKYMQIEAYYQGGGVEQGGIVGFYTLPRKLQCPSDLNVRDPARAYRGIVLISYGYNLEGLAEWGAPWPNLVGYKQSEVKNPAEKLMFTEGVGDWWVGWHGANYIRFWDRLGQRGTIEEYRALGGYGATAYRHSEGVNVLFYDGHVNYLKKGVVFTSIDIEDWDNLQPHPVRDGRIWKAK
ncbi:MAG: prepilin-type N-terminal cleavage/methylation domain-containing protein [Phycisphaerae bacterium]